MRYCHNCGRVTTGDPLYCQFCGRTYDVKLCPRHHLNSRSAQVCSQCGSRELSTPAPKIPIWLKPLFLLLSILPGFGLLFLSLVFIVVFIQRLLSDPGALTGMMVLGLMLGFCWYLWIHLPGFVRKLLRKAFIKGGKHADRNGH